MNSESKKQGRQERREQKQQEASRGRTQIFDAATDDSHRIVVTVDGQGVDTYENTIVRNGQRVEIRYEAIADTESDS